MLVFETPKSAAKISFGDLSYIKEQIASCDAMIIVLGGGQGELSPWISQEIGMAMAFKKRLIPMMFGDKNEKIPALLHELQVIWGRNPEDMLRILEDLNRELDVYPEKVFQRAADPLLSDYLIKIEGFIG